MKHFFLFLFLFVCISLNAQTVLGIDINTTKTEFASQMFKKGYKSPKKTANHYIYKVTMAGKENCNMDILFNSHSDSICSVEIVFPNESKSKNDWLYTELHIALENKYGEGKTNELLKSLYGYGAKKGSYIIDWKEPKISLIQSWNEYNEDNEHDNYVRLVYYTGQKSDEKKNIGDDL